eukprot:g16565.t1
MCAAHCGGRVLVVDHAKKPGEKIRISGGGRCNFTNTGCEPQNFLSSNPHFAKSALARYTPWDFVSLVSEHGIAWHEKTLGQLFCDDSAQQIVDMLTGMVAAAGGEIWMRTAVRGVEASGAGYTVSLDRGGAAVQLSSYWREGEPVMIDLLPGLDAMAALRDERARAGRRGLARALSVLVPARLADALTEELGLAGNLADMSDKVLDGVAARLHRWQVTPGGTEGYRTAEVTLGGVDTDGLSSQTMEAKAAPGLHFIGECVDVTGWLGGYNFQWAWASAMAAARAIGG